MEELVKPVTLVVTEMSVVVAKSEVVELVRLKDELVRGESVIDVEIVELDGIDVIGIDVETEMRVVLMLLESPVDDVVE